MKYPFLDPLVAQAYEAFPLKVRKPMLSARALIFATAASLPAVGRLSETLKWGEPAYLTSETGSGSTIRLAWKARHPEQWGIYFNCQTTLVDSFRTRFPADFRFDGNRALQFLPGEAIDMNALGLCIEAALTYHRRLTTR